MSNYFLCFSFHDTVLMSTFEVFLWSSPQSWYYGCGVLGCTIHGPFLRINLKILISEQKNSVNNFFLRTRILSSPSLELKFMALMCRVISHNYYLINKTWWFSSEISFYYTWLLEISGSEYSLIQPLITWTCFSCPGVSFSGGEN